MNSTALPIDRIINQARSQADDRRFSNESNWACEYQRLRLKTLHLVAQTTVACQGDAWQDKAWHEVLADSLSLAILAIRCQMGVELYDVQLRTGLVVSGGILAEQRPVQGQIQCRGAVAEMQTGEGKTLAMYVAAIIASLRGQGVHLATPNAYLARRDQSDLADAFGLLGLQSACLPEEAVASEPNDAARAAYRADVTYGTGHAFGFDFLRDRRLTHAAALRRPGASILDRLRTSVPDSGRVQRGLAIALVDEIDHVLIDDAATPLVLSGTREGDATDATVHRVAIHIAKKLRRGMHYQINGGRVEVSDSGLDLIYRHVDDVEGEVLLRPLHEYVELAVRATNLLQRDVHYVVEQNKIRLVDATTGRIHEDRTWSGGLHQSVQAKENLPVNHESKPIGTITRQAFYRSYRYLAGVTGTASDCADELRSVYGLSVDTIDPRVPSKRIIHPPHFASSKADKHHSIADEVAAMISVGRCVLVGTLDIATSHAVAAELHRRGIRHELLNGVQDASEADVIAGGGQPRAVTVATNVAGRGTDIRLHPDVSSAGGMHVIVAEHHSSVRVDRQLIGRCARGGDPGSSRVFISGEDHLVCNVAPWIGRAIVRLASRNANATVSEAKNVSSMIESVQAKEAKRAASARATLSGGLSKPEPPRNNLQLLGVG